MGRRREWGFERVASAFQACEGKESRSIEDLDGFSECVCVNNRRYAGVLPYDGLEAAKTPREAVVRTCADNARVQEMTMLQTMQLHKTKL